MFKKNIMRLLLCGLLFGLFGAAASLQACSVKLEIRSRTSVTLHEVAYNLVLTDSGDTQLFFQMLSGQIERSAGPGHTFKDLEAIQITCTDAERTLLADDSNLQGQLLEFLGRCRGLRALQLDNLGGGWLVSGLLGMTDLWLCGLQSVGLLTLQLEGQHADLERLLMRLSCVEVLALIEAGLRDFGPIERCIKGNFWPKLKVLSLRKNDFAGQEALIQCALDKCVKLEFLDLSECQLQQFPMKFKAAKKLRNLQVLNLLGNDFSLLADEDLGRFFSELHRLRKLDIWGCNFTSFGFLLRLPSKERVTLTCGGRNFAGHEAEFLEQIAAPGVFEGIIGAPMTERVGDRCRAVLVNASELYSFPSDVEELNLEGSNFSGESINFLPPLTRFTKLKKLSLRNSRFQDACMVQLICTACLWLEDLDVRGNFFDDDELLQALATVRESFPRVTVHADFFNEERGVVELRKIKFTCVSDIASLLTHWLPGVNELRLRACDFGDDEGSTALLFGVLRDAPRLRALRVRDSRLSLIAAGQQHLPRVEVLDFADCDLVGQEKALEALCLGAPRLRSLSLTSCGLQSCRFLGRLPEETLQQLVQLDLSENPLDQGSRELLMCLMSSCLAMNNYKDSLVEFHVRGSRTVLLVREASVEKCVAALDRLPANWSKRATELHLPGQSEADVQGTLAEAICNLFGSNLKSVLVRKGGEVQRIHVSKFRAAAKCAMVPGATGAEGASSSAVASEPVYSDEGEDAQAVTGDEIEGSDPESDDEGIEELCQAFSHLRTTGGASASAAPSKRGAKKPAKGGGAARSSAAASASGAAASAAAASSSSSGCVKRTEDIYVFDHPGHGELVLSCRTWDGDCGSKNYDISRLPADVIRAHCVGEATHERVRLNLSESYDAANPKCNLAHAFDIGAIDWIMRHPDTRMFIFRGGGANRLKTAANYRIAFILPVRLSWVGKDSRVMAKECFAVVSFGRDGVLHHACYHGGVDFHRYSRVRRGEVHIRFDEGSGRLSFDLEGLWGV